MSGIFSAPKTEVQPAPLTPAEDPALAIARDEAANRLRRKQLAGGKASTRLTGPLGDTSTAPVSATQLLGGGVL